MHVCAVVAVHVCSQSQLAVLISRRSSCAGAYNAVRGSKRDEVINYALFVARTDTMRFRVGSYGGLPSIVHIDCTGEGWFDGLDGGKVCKHCLDLRRARGSSNPSKSLATWYQSTTRCVERRQKEVLTALDIQDARRFMANSDKRLSPAGLELKQEAVALVEYASYTAKLARHMPEQTFKLIGKDSAPGLDAFLVDVAEVWQANPAFRSSLAVSIVKSAVAKSKYGPNAAMDEKILNFVRFIRTHDKKAAEVLSANLSGPDDRWMRRLDARDREPCILDSGKDGALTEKRMDEAIQRRSDNGGKSLAFSLAIDATKTPVLLEVAAGYRAVVGGEYPQHLIDIEGMSKQDVRKILDGASESGNIPLASEVKVAIMSFQGTPKGVPPFEVVAARPQSNNESNDFIKTMEQAASSAAVRNGRARFANFGVDGVSCESEHVNTAICKFLSLESNHTGSTDPNHNAKSWRYQIIAGGGIVGCTLGKYTIDVYYLRIATVAMELWRPNDFAADLPVVKLTSSHVIQKLANCPNLIGSTSQGDKGK